MTMVEKIAKAIYDATDPLSGDPIATLIHVSDHLFWDGVQPDREMTDIERQLEAVQEVCRAAARAALSATMEPTPGMVEAGLFAISGAANTGSIDHLWQTMITAALDEDEARQAGNMLLQRAPKNVRYYLMDKRGAWEVIRYSL